MDITNFDSEDINVFLARVKIDALRENKDVKRVLIRAFLGGNNGEQSTPLKRAYINVYKIYKRQGVELVLQTFTNDLVRNKYHWSCTQLFDYLVSADIHLLPTHLHQGMLALGGSDTWNTLNILRNMERLRYHLGTPNGTYIDDSVGNQSKKYYIALEKEGLCAPTLFVDIFCDEVSANDVGNIERFVKKIYEDTQYAKYRNDDKFVVKLPFSTNSTRMKYVIGFDGVLCALREFMENESIFGYIHYAIIQPEVPENAEVKIVCFDGVPAMKCKTKKGKSNRSPFGRAKREVFFDFARCVISTLRRVCPEIVSFQVLRIDIFGFRGRPGDFIVNEVEGYEAQKAGVGVDSGVEEGRILQKLEEYWTNLIYDLVEYHIKHELPRLGLKHPSEP